MKIESHKIIRYDRRFLMPWKTSAGEIAVRPVLILKLSADNGLIGWGEAAPLKGFSKETIEETDRALRAACEALTGQKFADNLEDIATQTYNLIDINIPSARFALETALCDLAAQSEGKKLSGFICSNPKTSVPVNHTAAYLENIEKVVSRVEHHGYKAVKLKVAIGQPEEEIEYINYLALKLGGTVGVRLDANRGWTYDQAIHFMDIMKNHNIEYVEEPLVKFDPSEYLRLGSKSVLPIALDESLTEYNDIESIFSYNWVNVLIIKPSLQGGIYRTLRLAEKASGFGKKTVITSLLETEIGIAALLHLAACLPEPALPCGLDTLRYFKDQRADIFSVESGRIAVPGDGFGLGIGEIHF